MYVTTVEDSAHGGHVASKSLMGHKMSIEARAPDGAPLEVPLEPGDALWAEHEPVSAIDPRDMPTPDDWIPRHPDLIRLTGRHPLNVEPPPTTLLEKGFITPVSLHYVRNHGAVPKIAWRDHRVTVNGLVDKPLTLAMDDIYNNFPHVTIPATLVCAGNRRKELNMVKKSKGFNWGPAGTSCGMWTGVRLRDVLLAAGIKSLSEGAAYVCFRGPKGELPQGSDGSYGTSVSRAKALDPGGDVILAFKHNGRLLTPDHGYPIRIIIPGYIGGRMVKWLEEITVTPTESDSFYHFYDNRVLPSHVDDALAKEEDWWHKPDFIINDLNINSAICFPAHDELVLLSKQAYTVRGYAYCGGGRKIIRCEVSLDDGDSWRLADIHRFEKPNEYGRYWAWVHFSLTIPMVDLVGTREICCRAWDDSMNTQPHLLTWNLMGMMNNGVFRVKIQPVELQEGLALHFEHPTVAGVTVGGWMNREEAPAAAAAPEAQVVTLAEAQGGRLITMDEVEAHTTAESAWFVRSGKVYDATPFLSEHPGGAESILIVAGTDATEEFDAIHSAKAKEMLLKYEIGTLCLAPTTPPSEEDPASKVTAFSRAAALPAAAESELVALNPRKRISCQLLRKEILTHNTRRLRFALPSPEHRFGLPIGQHVYIYARVNDELVMRAYTPTSSDGERGYFDLVIKVYHANQHPEFPAGGKLTPHLDSLQLGDSIEVKGPVGHFSYLGLGRFMQHGHERTAARYSLIAGGTGITPCYQVIKAVLSDPEDPTQLSLVFCNQSPADILLFEELLEMAKDERFSVWFTVSSVGDGRDWQYDVGQIGEAMFRKHLFPADPATVALICGPPGMVKMGTLPNLEKMGYAADNMIVF